MTKDAPSRRLRTSSTTSGRTPVRSSGPRTAIGRSTRSLVDPKQFPTPTDLFTIKEFGGWDKVNDEFFDEASGSVAKIEEDLGVSTAG